MIKRLKVEGLNVKVNADLEFNEDLNIITGANGSGKTTLLKLMWYLISGQIDRTFDISLDFVLIETDQFELSISRWDHYEDESLIEWRFFDEDSEAVTEFTEDSEMEIEESLEDNEVEVRESLYINVWDVQSNADARINSLAARIRDTMKRSLFFPSFRRIESGFSRIFQDTNSTRRRGRPSRNVSTQTRDSLQEAMSEQSVEQSVDNHKFVTSFSTTDIIDLLSQKRTEISNGINAIYAGLSHDLAKRIPSEPALELQDANSVLQQIHEEFTKAVSEEQKLRNQLTSLHGLISKIFKEYGIEIEDGFTLGKEDYAMSSDVLSYGEQQMLSFLCYNAFSSNTAIFIDEPELSLHIDWQRLLLPTLLDQKSGNQFFMTTHSPFIFSKYQEKELLLGDDRGDEGGEI